MLRVSFRERKDRLEKQKKFEKERQEKLRLIQERKEQLKKELKLQQTGLSECYTTHTPILPAKLDFLSLFVDQQSIIDWPNYCSWLILGIPFLGTIDNDDVININSELVWTKLGWS